MTRLLRPLLLAAALLFSQHAVVLHDLAHARHQLASHEGDKAPELDHGIDVCTAFGAMAQALGNAATAQLHALARVAGQSTAFESVSARTRIVFDSRAPPLSA